MGHIFTAALLSAGTITATGWANDPVITTAACVICGLHVETNLQVITKSANRRKGRKHHE